MLWYGSNQMEFSAETILKLISETPGDLRYPMAAHLNRRRATQHRPETCSNVSQLLRTTRAAKSPKVPRPPLSINRFKQNNIRLVANDQVLNAASLVLISRHLLFGSGTCVLPRPRGRLPIVFNVGPLDPWREVKREVASQ